MIQTGSPALTASPSSSDGHRVEQSTETVEPSGCFSDRGGPRAESAPWVVPVSAIPSHCTAREAVAAGLLIVARELKPVATTFCRVGHDGDITVSVVHGARQSLSELTEGVSMWKAKLRGLDPLAPAALTRLRGRIATLGEVDGAQTSPKARLWSVYQEIGVINDVGLLIRERGRLVACITLWRSLHRRAWTRRQLAQLNALQPLIEMAYVAARRVDSTIDARFPATLTRREREVAHVLATGATNAEVARALCVSPNTAKSHTRAVLAKLGVASRRELLIHGTRASPDHVLKRGSFHSPSDVSAWTQGVPRGDQTIRVEGDETPRRLLALLLDWAAVRIGAVMGGCAVFSARLELVAEALAVARTEPDGLDWRLVRCVHRQMLPPGRPRELVRQVVDGRAQSPVIELGVAGPRPGNERLTDLGKLGLTAPLLTVLRLQGRTAGVIWLAREAHAPIDQRDSVQALRGLHPLLELAYATPLGESHTRVSKLGDLRDCGLTPRELTVARLALSGTSNAAIAAQLEISRSTVENHMTHILEKCGVRSRTQLIAILADAKD